MTPTTMSPNDGRIDVTGPQPEGACFAYRCLFAPCVFLLLATRAGGALCYPSERFLFGGRFAWQASQASVNDGEARPRKAPQWEKARCMLRLLVHIVILAPR